MSITTRPARSRRRLAAAAAAGAALSIVAGAAGAAQAAPDSPVDPFAPDFGPNVTIVDPATPFDEVPNALASMGQAGGAGSGMTVVEL